MHGRSDVQESVVVNAQLAALVDANDGQRESERARESARASEREKRESARAREPASKRASERKCQ